MFQYIALLLGVLPVASTQEQLSHKIHIASCVSHLSDEDKGITTEAGVYVQDFLERSQIPVVWTDGCDDEVAAFAYRLEVVEDSRPPKKHWWQKRKISEPKDDIIASLVDDFQLVVRYDFAKNLAKVKRSQCRSPGKIIGAAIVAMIVRQKSGQVGMLHWYQNPDLAFINANNPQGFMTNEASATLRQALR
jgi:hypothetical protein